MYSTNNLPSVAIASAFDVFEFGQFDSIDIQNVCWGLPIIVNAIGECPVNKVRQA